MEHFELTKKYMEKAITYMPLAQKTILAELIARKCLKPIKPLNEKDNIDSFLVISSIVGEDNLQKEQLLLNTLLSHYFDIEIPQMDNQLYDYYMGGHLLNQLERFKCDNEYKTKAFDILADFKIIKRMVETEIYNLKTKENDIAERILKGISLWSAEKMTNDPEYAKKMKDELKKFLETANQVGETEHVSEMGMVDEEESEETQGA